MELSVEMAMQVLGVQQEGKVFNWGGKKIKRDKENAELNFLKTVMGQQHHNPKKTRVVDGYTFLSLLVLGFNQGKKMKFCVTPGHCATLSIIGVRKTGNGVGRATLRIQNGEKPREITVKTRAQTKPLCILSNGPW